MGGFVQPAAHARGMRERQVPPPIPLMHAADDRGKELLPQEGINRHLAHQDHQRGLQQLQLPIEEVPAQRQLRARGRPIAVANRGFAREAPGERGQQGYLSVGARGEAGALKPLVQRSPRGAGEVVALLVRHRPGSLADDEDLLAASADRPDGVRAGEIPGLLTGAAREDLGLQSRELGGLVTC